MPDRVAGLDVQPLRIPGLLLLTPHRFEDHRGTFVECWNEARFRKAGIDTGWKQDNVATSKKGVVRGLHFQEPRPQAKLITALGGEIFDVAVDLRRDSPTFGEWEGVRLSRENRMLFYIPAGFAHGYAALSDGVVVFYKCSELYRAEYDRAIRWDDPELGIEWPVREPVLSEKDRTAPGFGEWRRRWHHSGARPAHEI
jgi:dTDP-4-dehydrorhamnose 3,5-epimerase